MKHIISPGFAKSGTTLLHALLARSQILASPKAGKEPNIFLTDTTVPYADLFKIDEKTVATFEFSPSYFSIQNRRRRKDLWQRIKLTLEKPLVVIALRSPFERAVSAYIHQLQDFSRFGLGGYSQKNMNIGAVYSYSFEAAVCADPVVGLDMSDVVSEVIEEFTYEQTLFFFLETDVVDMNPFVARLSDKLQTELNLGTLTGLRVANPGGRIPTNFYSEKGNDIVLADNREFRLPHRTLYVATDRGHLLLPDVEPQVGRSWIMASKLWTAIYDTDLWNRAWNWGFADMAHRLDEIVADSEDAARNPGYSEMKSRSKRIDYVPFSASFLEEVLSE